MAEARTLKGFYVGLPAPQPRRAEDDCAFRAGRLPAGQLLTRRPKLDELNEDFDRLREGFGEAGVALD